MNAYTKAIARFLLLVLVIQLIRGLIVTGLWSIVQPAPNSIQWAYMDMIAFSLLGMGLISFFRPSVSQLALDWEAAPRWERIAYISMGLLTLALLATTYVLQPGVFITNLNSVLVIPIFEELLFRGWGWTQLEQAAAFRNSRIVNWLVISVLFGIWHFGYLDVYVLKVAPAWPDMQWSSFLLMKFVTTFIIGLVVGLPRRQTCRVHGSLILHALINLFGR